MTRTVWLRAESHRVFQLHLFLTENILGFASFWSDDFFATHQSNHIQSFFLNNSLDGFGVQDNLWEVHFCLLCLQIFLEVSIYSLVRSSLSLFSTQLRAQAWCSKLTFLYSKATAALSSRTRHVCYCTFFESTPTASQRHTSAFHFIVPRSSARMFCCRLFWCGLVVKCQTGYSTVVWFKWQEVLVTCFHHVPKPKTTETTKGIRLARKLWERFREFHDFWIF